MQRDTESELTSSVNREEAITGDTGSFEDTQTQPPKTKGCAINFWKSVRVVLYVLWISIGSLLCVASIGVLRPEERDMYGFWGVVGLLWLFFIVFYGVSAFIRLLLRFVTKLLRKMA